jgi:hypothetical protein
VVFISGALTDRYGVPEIHRRIYSEARCRLVRLVRTHEDHTDALPDELLERFPSRAPLSILGRQANYDQAGIEEIVGVTTTPVGPEIRFQDAVSKAVIAPGDRIAFSLPESENERNTWMAQTACSLAGVARAKA